jgi:methylenetetrahydrofolate reductase (NADPH)
VNPVSFEFFPPQTAEGLQKLLAARADLAPCAPEYFSVTYGAGGSTRERSQGAVMAIQATGSEVAPHISCMGSTRDTVREVLQGYQDAGIRRLVALRGDLPSGVVESGHFRYAADLVAFIRQVFGDSFSIAVAAYPEVHPQARSARDDLAHFKSKVEAGADGAITQYFYNPDAYFHFVEDCRAAGIRVPVVPGIMPIVRYFQLARFSDNCGAEIPRWIRKKLEQFGDDTDSVKAFGTEVVSELCSTLLARGAPGLHFYTMNQAAPTLSILKGMGLA